jgi:hypothetical protein
MIHVGQQSAFPKLKFIANRAKLEYAIQEGRRKYRPRGSREGDLINAMSEEDLRSLLKRTRSDGPDGGAPYPASGSESSSTAADGSRPGSPVDLPLGFSFSRKKKGPTNLVPSPDKQLDAPDSPSLSKRLSGWWSAMSPQATAHSTAINSQRAKSRSRAALDRPSSMFEFSHPKDSSDLRPGRQQSQLFGDEDSDGNRETHGEARRKQQQRGGVFGAEDPGADNTEYRGEIADFGDDEEDGDEIQNVGVGLGLQGQAL